MIFRWLSWIDLAPQFLSISNHVYYIATSQDAMMFTETISDLKMPRTGLGQVAC